MNPFEELEKANILYKEKRFAAAAEAFSKIATDLYVQDENGDLGEIAMKLAVESYIKILDPKLLYSILKLTEKNLFSQFFCIKNFLEDHNQEKNLYKIQKLINRYIPLNRAEKRLASGKVIIPTSPNKILTANYRIGSYQATVLAAQGPRERMEDFYIAGDLTTKNGVIGQFFAVLDGHGGDRCVKFVKNQLKRQIIKHLNTDDDLSIYNSIRSICIHIDHKWKEYAYRSSASWRDVSGCAVIFALIIQKALWVVGIGDSRAVLGKGEEVIQLSEDAKPPIEKYHMEIMKRGGFVKWKRVDGSLDMARSIGDIDHPSVSAKPCVRKFDLSRLEQDKKNILILATDGLWDVLGSQEAVLLCQNFKSPKAMAAELVSAAYIHGSTDNVTVMVVKL